MRSALLLPGCLAFLGASSVQAQNFVQNGDFSWGLQGWTVTGWADAPGVVPFNTSGLGTTDAFGCNPGANVFPVPPNYDFLTLTQNVVVASGAPYEFYADIALDGNFNNEGGLIRVHLGGRLVASHDFGAVALGGELRRTVLCERFIAGFSGLLPLSIEFSRQFMALSGRTPRNYIDNISLALSPGPAFCILGNRNLGNTVDATVAGNPGAAFAVFLSSRSLATGLNIPGVAGEWHLDPSRIFLFLSGPLDPAGAFTVSLPLPMDASLHLVPLWFQGFQADAGSMSLGVHHNFGLFR